MTRRLNTSPNNNNNNNNNNNKKRTQKRTQPRLKSRTSPLNHPACKNIVCNCYTCNKYSSVHVKRVTSYVLVTSASPCTPPNVRRPANKTGKQFNSIRPEQCFIKKKTGKGRVDEIPDTSKNTPQSRMCKRHRHEHPDFPEKKKGNKIQICPVISLFCNRYSDWPRQQL